MRSASADLRTFADDKSCTGALRVIVRHYVSRNVTRCLLYTSRTHEQTTAAERQTTFNDMIKIALESVLLGDKE